MKTDRELLEMAAKAADMGPFTAWGKAFVCGAGLPPKAEWNPLTDDGDALRLAVKLGLCIHPRAGVTLDDDGERDFVSVYDGASKAEFEQEVGDDRPAATRRAIVRAAAAIGEAMP